MAKLKIIEKLSGKISYFVHDRELKESWLSNDMSEATELQTENEITGAIEISKMIADIENRGPIETEVIDL